MPHELQVFPFCLVVTCIDSNSLCVHHARFTLILSDDPSPDLWSFTQMHALITELNTWGRSSEDLWASLCVYLSYLCTPWTHWSLGLCISNSESWLDSTCIFLLFAVDQKFLWGNNLGQSGLTLLVSCSSRIDLLHFLSLTSTV